MNQLYLGIYAVAIFIVTTLNPVIFNPLIYDAMISEHKTPVWHFKPTYPLGYWVILFSVFPVIFLKYRDQIIYYLFKKESTPLQISLYTFFTMLLIFCSLSWNYNYYTSMYISWSLIYSGIYGLISGLINVKISNPFEHKRNIPSDAKIAYLNSLIESWKFWLNVFLIIVIGAIISGTINLVLNSEKAFGNISFWWLYLDILLHISILSIGLAVGILWQIISKINQLSKYYLEIENH